MRKYQQHALSEPECHHELRNSTIVRPHPAIVDFFIQHTCLRKSGQRKLYLSIPSDVRLIAFELDGAGMFSGVSAQIGIGHLPRK